METIKHLFPLILQASLILIVAAVGLQARWIDFLEGFRQPGLLLRGIIAVNIVVPVVAVILVALFPLDGPVKAAIVLMAVSPLAPFVPGKMLKAGEPPSFAVGLYVALMLLAVIIVPLTLVLLSWLFPADAYIAPMAIAKLVLLSVLLPLVAGVAIGAIAPAFAQRAAPIVLIIANIGLVVVLVPMLIVLARPMLAALGNGTLVVIVLTVLAGLVAGHLLGGPVPADRTALALAASTRHPGMAIMIAGANFHDPHINPAVILFLLVGILVSGIYAGWAAKRHAGAAPS